MEAHPVSSANTPAPTCFLQDTVYHIVIDLSEQMINLHYGAFPLVSCSFEVQSDTDDIADFGKRWREQKRTLWQNVRGRAVWAGEDAVSDTVVNVVSEIVKVDPERIRRVMPDRFRVDITGGFQILSITPEGEEGRWSFAEAWGDLTSRILAMGRLSVLRIKVTRADAQTLYYALEPGTPIIVVTETNT
ncbi:MAG: hypothetical protein GF341_03560 [candidate division Zixibacteria bacterium]|nr:hypothetical protein [candidate division Zixibacteria bacterium]